MNKIINENQSYCLGMSLTIEALVKKPIFVKKIYLSNKANKNEQLDYLLKLITDNNISFEYNDEVINKLSLKENCYCICVFDKFYNNLISNNHIVLYKFNSFGDLGTVLRSAVSFNLKDIVLIDCGFDYFDPRCVRASMGAIFHCNIKKYDSINDYISKYNKQTIVPFLSKSSKELSNLKIDNNYSIIISENYYDLDNMFNDGYYIKHREGEEISLAIRSSIIFNQLFYLNRNR